MRLLLFLLFSFQIAFAAEEDFKRTLLQKGLPSKVSVQVRDFDGNTVPNATVLMSFSVHNQRNSNIVEGKTDEFGIASGEALLNNKIAIHVTKDGYYETFFRYDPWTNGRYDSGRWEPWNPTINITLYPKDNPRQNVEKVSRSYENLSQDADYGFDMMEKSIVFPEDKEKTGDFFVKGRGSYTMVTNENSRQAEFFITNKLEIAFANEGDGVIRKAKNKDSEFLFTYIAPESGYEQKMQFFKVYSPKHKSSTFVSDDEYLIVRISRKDDKTGEMRRYYGIITRFRGGTSIEGKRSFDIWYYLNPEPDDRNIEY